MCKLILVFILLASPVLAATVNVTDPTFAAVGDLRTCADMQMTSGSATLYSPSQCAFVLGDVGKYVQVPLAGDSNGTGLSTTIASFTDSQHVTLSAMAGEDANSGTAGTIGTGNYAALVAVAAYACANPNTTVNWPAGSYYIEKYKITGGGSANGVTDITWTGCSGTINAGTGAAVVSNGSYRQAQDDGAYSYEATVSPFRVANSTMTIEGLEVNGSVEETSAAYVSANQSYGIVVYGSTVTLENLNIHSFPTDCLILGFNSLDSSDVVTNVQTHNCARQGLTVANVAGLLATNFQCTQIGTGYVGQYIGQPPEDCVDVEPAIAPYASGLVFNGGSASDAVGSLIAITQGTTTAIVENMTLDATTTTNGAFYLGAAYTLFTNNTILGQFSCGINGHSAKVTAIYVTNNTMTLPTIPSIVCHDNDILGIPVFFNGNNITITGTSAPPGAMSFVYLAQANGNSFSVSKNAKNAGSTNIVNWTGTQSVSNNNYSTDSTTADEYAVVYTGVNLACGEVSQEPTYFVVTGGNAPCPPTNIGAGVTIGSGVTIQ